MVERAPSENRRGKALGCLAVIVSCVTITLATCSYLNDRRYAAMLPSAITVERRIATDSTFGLREGCDFALFEITEETALTVASQGLAFFEHKSIPGEDARNGYVGWRATASQPITEQRESNPHLFALGADGGCSNDRLHDGFDATSALAKPGAYYNVTSNGEGLVIIDPAARRAAYMYFG